MTSTKQKQKSGNYQSYKQRSQKQDGSDRTGLIDSAYLRYIIYIAVLSVMLPRLHSFIDEKIDGKWRQYPPFSFINHPRDDFFLTGEEIIRKYGYNVEPLYVQTEDGYINHMHRLNKFSAEELDSNSPKPAVLLIHGHLDSSDTWIVNGNKSIAFILAETGYDVYLANTRGNKYSMGHVKLDHRTQAEYWDNTMSNYQAKYDVPAFLEKIKQLSNVASVSMITHSLASRCMIQNLQENATYFKSSVNNLILLSPFVKLPGLSLPNTILTVGNNLIDDYSPDFLHIYHSLPNPGFIQHKFKYVCGYITPYCEWWQFYMVHTTDEFIDKQSQVVFFSKYPGQSTFKNWQLFGQLIRSKQPAMYDFGSKENVKRYGQSTPPNINVQKAGQVGVPITMFPAKHDVMVTIEEARKLRDTLGASVSYTELDGGHSTFFIAKDISMMKEKLLESLSRHNQKHQVTVTRKSD